MTPTHPTQSYVACAREAIERAVRGRTPDDAPAGRLAPPADYGGVFVTLYRGGRLRGCIGCLDTSLEFERALRRAAVDAALNDPRFPPVGPGELADLRIQVSILSRAVRTADPLSLEPGRHGVLIQRGERRGLFLPQVATEHRLDKESFLSRCCSEKAGLPPDAWRDPDTEVWLFTAQVYDE